MDLIEQNIDRIFTVRKRMIDREEWARADDMLIFERTRHAIEGSGAWNQDGEPLITADEALALAERTARELEHSTLYAVQRARREGMTWEAIGTRMGITRQAATKKWGPYCARELFGSDRRA